MKYSVGHALRMTRQFNNMTLRDLSKASFISLGHLSEVERGIKEPSFTLLGNMLEALKVSPRDFWNLVSDIEELTK